MFSLRVDAEIELVLREERHAQAIFDLTERNRAHLREWLPWLDATTTVEDTRNFIRGSLQQFAANNGFQAGILFKGELAGMIGYHFINWSSRRTEIGYWLAQAYEGKGIMTRAARKLTDYAFTDLGLNRVEIKCATGNLKSRAIPERLGFTEEGTLRQVAWHYDHFLDLVVYSLLADEWGGAGA
jgi:ribosomal-protein-serine acetyltransferase